MNEVETLFEDEEEIARRVHEIARRVLNLGEYVTDQSVLELARAEVIGKQVREECDLIASKVHHARRQVGVMLSQAETVRLKGAERKLEEVLERLSMVHGDIDAIGRLAEGFFEAKDRNVAFGNMSKLYARFIGHMTDVLSSSKSLPALL